MRNARRHEESIREVFKNPFLHLPSRKKSVSMNEHRTYACDFIRFFFSFVGKNNSYAILRGETKIIAKVCRNLMMHHTGSANILNIRVVTI